ncbi:hypothetical protein [Bradyrhizobium lupini]|uniref:hypothetical protein n=1 Tax=Rhizobium lupini TaxID=136996 RepID=UPI0034C6C836
MESEETIALRERIAETIEDFCTDRGMTASEVLQAIEYVYARVERHNEDTPGWVKMH